MSLFEAASGFANRYVPEKTFRALRTQYLSVRRRLHPVLRMAYGSFDVTALRHHLEQRIGSNFEILMVHSSMNKMSPMFTDRPLDLVRMLMSFCGPNRTLVMPAFYFGDPAVGGAYLTFKERPRFNVNRVPSQMGLLTELFRRSKGVMHSRHPVYRVSALGPLAKQLTHGHELTKTSTGHGTPFDFMANHDTLIVGIGKSFEVLTQVHHAEDIMGDDFPVPRSSENVLTMTLIDGEEEIPFKLSQRSLLWRRNMWKLRSIMGPEILQESKFCHVPMFTTRAADVTTALISAAERGVTLYEKP